MNKNIAFKLYTFLLLCSLKLDAQEKLNLAKITESPFTNFKFTWNKNQNLLEDKINPVRLPSLSVYDSLPDTGKIAKSSLDTDGTQNPDIENILNGVTFGFGAGYSFLSGSICDYSLSPNDNFLQIQNLSKSRFVISSVLSIKLNSVAVNDQNRMVSFKKTKQGNYITKKYRNNTGDPTVKYRPQFAINASLNLAEINNGDVAFNKNIDGGLGLGCYLTPELQVVLFYDFVSIRQLRDYVLDYERKVIPKTASENYNALDKNDDNLFYNKSFSGISLKMVFSIGNKKVTTNANP